MAMVRRLALLSIVLTSVVGSFSAQALPTEKIYLTATRLLDAQGPIYFVGYMKLEEDENKRVGYQVQPMEEGVADVLSGMTEEKIYECDGRFLRNARFVYVYALTGCK